MDEQYSVSLSPLASPLFTSALLIWEIHRDCTHGVISAVTQALPILQTDNEEAAVALNCGLNTPTWENDEQFLYTWDTLFDKPLTAGN